MDPRASNRFKYLFSNVFIASAVRLGVLWARYLRSSTGPGSSRVRIRTRLEPGPVLLRKYRAHNAPSLTAEAIKTFENKYLNRFEARGSIHAPVRARRGKRCYTRHYNAGHNT